MIFPTYHAKCDNCQNDFECKFIQDGVMTEMTFDDESSLCLVLDHNEWHNDSGKNYCPDCVLGYDDSDKVILI